MSDGTDQHPAGQRAREPRHWSASRREESLDRATAIRQAARDDRSRTWELEHAMLGVQTRRSSRSAGPRRKPGLAMWELLDAVRVAGLAYPLTGDEAEARLERTRRARASQRCPTSRRKPGRRTTGRNQPGAGLGRGGSLLPRPSRPPALAATASTSVCSKNARTGRRGRGVRCCRPRADRPRQTTDAVLGPDLAGRAAHRRRRATREDPRVAPRPGAVRVQGAGRASCSAVRLSQAGTGNVEGVPASCSEARTRRERRRAESTESSCSMHLDVASAGDTIRTQRVTAKETDRRPRIRFPRKAKRLFPVDRGEVEIVLRGARLR